MGKGYIKPEPEEVYRELKEVVETILKEGAGYRSLREELLRLEADLIQRVGREFWVTYGGKQQDQQDLIAEVAFKIGFIFGRNLAGLDKDLERLRESLKGT